MYYNTHPDYNYKPFNVIGGAHEGKPYISRISPSLGQVEFEWFDLLNQDNDECTVYYSYNTMDFESFSANGKTVIFSTKPSRDVSFYIETKDGRKSEIRLVNTGGFPGKVINYLHPADKQYKHFGRFLASPSLVRLQNGDLLASMDVFALGQAMNRTMIFRSRDDGEKWEYVTDVYPAFWGTLFLNNDNVYLVCTSGEYGDMQILESCDNGESWHGIVLDRGVGVALVGYHRAPTPVVRHNGRIWISMEYGSWDIGKFMPMVWSIDEKDDLMVASNWKRSKMFDSTQSLEGVDDNRRGVMIEGNLVLDNEGRLLNILRHSKEKAVVLLVDDKDPEGELKYICALNAEIAFSKFYIQKHNDVYYAVGNRSPYRNEILLCTSENCLDWTCSKVLLDYSEQPAASFGIQYPYYFIEGDTIYLALRTAACGAENYHNSNAITFHKFKI